jgi:phosphatidate cytidylyltransferase
MALNLKTLGTRSLSAVVFVALLLGSVVWNYFSFTLFFLVVAIGGLIEFYSMIKKTGARPFIVPGIIFGLATYVCFINWPFEQADQMIKFHLLSFKIVLVISCAGILAIAMLSEKENSIKNAFYTIGGIIYCVLPFALLNQICFESDMEGTHYHPAIILGAIFLIWSNDTFAYLGGSLVGKNKMIERISPGKTWEGTIIGVIVTFGLSFCFDTLLMPLENHLWVILGGIVPILATLGDLIESKMKREAGVKDSGSIMPGHGGFLDRFDSLIFVAPFLYAIIVLFKP